MPARYSRFPFLSVPPNHYAEGVRLRYLLPQHVHFYARRLQAKGRGLGDELSTAATTVWAQNVYT